MNEKQDTKQSMGRNVVKFACGKLTVAALIVTVVFVNLNSAEAADNSSSNTVPVFRYPVDTSGPGLRLVSLLHDTRAKTFAQGERSSDQEQNKSYFARPRYVAIGNAGEIYTLDGARGVIYQMTYKDGALQKSSRLPAKDRNFLSPIAMAVSPDGAIWLTDSRQRAVFILDPDGKVLDSLTGMFTRPVGIVYNSRTRSMFVTDLASNTIVEVSLQKEILNTHGTSDSVILEGPSFIAVGPNGDFYIVEALGGGVAIFSSEWKLLRKLGEFGDGPGYFSKPKGIAVDGAGRVYIADALFDNVQIFNKDDQLLLTLGRGGAAPGQFLQPMGVAIDDSGDIYIADSYNGRVQVFRWEDIDK